MEEVKSSSAPGSPARTPPPAGQNADIVIENYMERLGTRLGVLETELRYAWRALDLLSQEYIKMWERLEKLEVLLYEQQSVISQLIEFYSSVEPNETEMDLLDRPRIIQGISSVDEIGLLNSDLALSTSASQFINELKLQIGPDGDVLGLPDESFYRSLNNAYRNDLGCPSSSMAASGSSQLGMIWEESEEDSNGTTKREENKDLVTASGETQVFSSLDYKDYRGSSPCVSDHDLVPLSQLSTVDQVALEKLKELDRLTTKLQKDSQNLKELQDRLLADSPKHKYSKDTTDVSEITVREDKTNEIDDQLRRMCAETELDNWGFSTTTRAITDMLMMSSAEAAASPRLVVEEPSHDTGSVSGFISTPTSPRRFMTSPSIMYSSTSRLTGAGASLNDIAASQRSLPLSPKSDRFSKTSYMTDPSLVGRDLFSSGTMNEDVSYSLSPERVSSPTPSLIRTRQDGYIDAVPLRDEEDLDDTLKQNSSSPPPPAPKDSSIYLTPSDHIDGILRKSPISMFNSQGASSSSAEIQGRRSPRTPHSPKSPRSSPKHAIVKSSSTHIVTAKSDSGLSSMSGWSSLEKSPDGLNSKTSISYASENLAHIGRISQQHPINPPSYSTSSVSVPTTYVDISDYNFGDVRNNNYNHLLPGGLRTSAFTTVRTPTTIPGDVLLNHSDNSNFVPPPAPEIPSSSKRRSRYDYENTSMQGEYCYYNDQPAIYSVAGSHRQDFTSVYTSGAANYLPTTTVSTYPDLIGPHPSQDQYSSSSSSSYRTSHDHRTQSTSSYPVTSTTPAKRGLTRGYSTGSVPSGGGVSNMEEYKTAMYRTMFPTGNITDALSYYPTNANYDGQPLRPDYNAWIPEQQPRMVRDHTSSTIRSAMSVDYDARGYDPRYYQAAQTHFRREMAYSDMDIRSKGATDVINQPSDMAYYDPSSVIVSQSGYISIASDLKEPQEDKSKKPKKGGLKSAMSSVSNWLPEIHLSKRHRSYSLPSGVRREDLELTKEPNKQFTQSLRSKQPPSSRKKKKNHLVSTMSGFLQKAKSRTQRHQQSMSDPEHSETEWSSRHSGVSEDSEPDSVFSDAQDNSIFTKMSHDSHASNVNANVSNTYQSPSQSQPDYSETSTVEADERYKPEVRQEIQGDHRVLDQRIEQRSDQQFDQRPDQRIFQRSGSIQEQRIEIQNNDQRGMEQRHDLRDYVPEREEKPTNTIDLFEDPFVASSLFPTVGDVKRPQSQNDNGEQSGDGIQFPPVTLGSASREFAVSRALGKYRRRQSSTQLEETPVTEEPPPPKHRDEIFTVITTDEEEEELRRNEIFERISSEENNKQAQINIEEQYLNDASPNISRHGRPYPPPRHQASLEIPWGGRGSGDTDDDNRSTHSWRSTSRVSSRRQSTEDSIDSEDEWYCYELRKLEELERQSKLEAELQHLQEDYEPEEDVRERMSTVLQELRSKVRRNDEDIPGSRRGSRDSRRGSIEAARRSSYERIDDRPGDRYDRETRRESYERIAMEPRRLSQEFNENEFRRESVDDRRGSFRDKERRKFNESIRDDYDNRQAYGVYDERYSGDEFHRSELDELQRDERLREERMRDERVRDEQIRDERIRDERVRDERVRDKPKLQDDEDMFEETQGGSSGETSGPDSPQHSAEELEVDEAKAVAAELEMMRRCSSSSGVRQIEQRGSGSGSREGSLSVGPSEMSVSIPEGWDTEETATVREGSVSVAASDVSSDRPGTPSLPRFKSEGDPSVSGKDEPPGGKDGPMGSKWKLLKALKERKAELKSQQEAAQSETTVTPTTVSN